MAVPAAPITASNQMRHGWVYFLDECMVILFRIASLFHRNYIIYVKYVN